MRADWNAVTIERSALQGEVHVPPSKSLSHRAILAACLAQGTSRVDNVVLSEDILATIGAMEAMGASVQRTPDAAGRTALRIRGIGDASRRTGVCRIDCRESGSTLRFCIPLAMVHCEESEFTGSGALPTRPLGVYTDLFDAQGIPYEHPGGRLPLRLRGALKPGVHTLAGNVSSQFITGLLFSLPLLAGDSEIRLSTPLESSGYVDLTLDVLARFGIRIEPTGSGWRVPGRQRFRAADWSVEGDYSQSVFLLGAGILGGRVSVRGLPRTSAQGDSVILSHLQSMRADVRWEGDLLVARRRRTSALRADCGECPDLVPGLAVLCALAEGQSELANLSRLRIKECDRLEAVYRNLSALGADIRLEKDALHITGRARLRGGRVDGWNDHRMVMSMAVAALACEKPLTVTDPDSVRKSWPGFWQDYKALGGAIDERNMG